MHTDLGFTIADITTFPEKPGQWSTKDVVVCSNQSWVIASQKFEQKTWNGVQYFNCLKLLLSSLKHYPRLREVVDGIVGFLVKNTGKQMEIEVKDSIKEDIDSVGTQLDTFFDCYIQNSTNKIFNIAMERFNATNNPK